MFYCYKITNIVNGKIYVGKTKNIQTRWASHRSRAFNPKDRRYNFPLSCAIRKYGVPNFTFEVLQICETEEEINYYEEIYISKFHTNINIYGGDFGYNLTNGGEKNAGRKHTKETIVKMKLAHQGILHTKESKEKIGKAHEGMRHSEETKNIIREAFSGEKSITAKLTLNLVNMIREEYASSLFSQQQLAEKYSVSVSNIGSITRNESWRK
jgi:group I intron endonuclease